MKLRTALWICGLEEVSRQRNSTGISHDIHIPRKVTDALSVAGRVMNNSKNAEGVCDAMLDLPTRHQARSNTASLHHFIDSCGFFEECLHTSSLLCFR